MNQVLSLGVLVVLTLSILVMSWGPQDSVKGSPLKDPIRSGGNSWLSLGSERDFILSKTNNLNRFKVVPAKME
jgi:hypothetical protein